MKKLKAVLISDLHFTLNSLEIASSALCKAKKKAISEKVPLIICGDTLDGKAIIRAECANRLISVLNDTRLSKYILVGNHDLCNEKGSEHALNFLSPYATIIDTPRYEFDLGLWLIPYKSDSQMMQEYVNSIPTGSTIIAHQGVQTAFMGEYIQDHSSLPTEVFKHVRTISGHYHRHQTIDCTGNFGRTESGIGQFTYVGTPYTTSFSEANDGPKGFQILYDDGSLELVPTNLRKHVILDLNVEFLNSPVLKQIAPDDLVWIRVRGAFSSLQKLNKPELGRKLLGHENFKLELIPNERNDVFVSRNLSPESMIDTLIDGLNDTDELKTSLKKLWRDLLP